MPSLRCSERAISLVFVVIIGVMGCEDEPDHPSRCSDVAGSTQLPDVPLAYSTEHLDIHVDEDRMFCAGSALEYERFYQYVGAELGAELPTRTSVFLSDTIVRQCPDGSAGCRKIDGVIFTNTGAAFHELTHAATCEWRNGSTPYLEEGMAVGFDAMPLATPYWDTWEEDLRDVITQGRDSFRSDDQAAHFVRWLLEERDPAAFRVLFETSPRLGGEGAFDALESAYGQDVDSLLTEYKASAPFTWVPHRQCADLSVLEPIDGSWAFKRVFDCDDPSTMGPWEREGTQASYLSDTTMYQSFLLEIEEPGVYQFQREVETSVIVERCLDNVALSEAQADDLWLREYLIPGLQGGSEVELPAGTYRVDVQREYAEPHPVELKIMQIPD